MKIYTKLFQLQQSIEAIPKDSNNPFFNSHYFDINTIINVLKPHLAKAGLVIIQPIVLVEGKNVLRTIVADQETGESIESSLVLSEVQKPQDMGSLITYMRRYAIQSMLLLEAEDDDGNTASGNYPQRSTTKSAPIPAHKLQQADGSKELCANCNTRITQKVYDWSVQKYGKALCMNCQPK